MATGAVNSSDWETVPAPSKASDSDWEPVKSGEWESVSSNNTQGLEPRNWLEKTADVVTLGGTRKFREGIERIFPGPGLHPSSDVEELAGGASDVLEGGMRALAPKAIESAIITLGAAPNIVRGLMAVAKPYFYGALGGAAGKIGASAAGAGENVSNLAGTAIGAATGAASGALKSKTEFNGKLPELPAPVKFGIRRFPWGHELLAAYEHARKTGVVPTSAAAARPGLKPPKFGGSYEPEIEATPGKTIPRKSPTETPRTTPYPRGKGTKTAYGGSTDEYGGPSYKMARKKLPGPSSSKEAGAEGKVQPMPQASTIDTGRVAARMKEKGIDRKTWEAMTSKQRKDILAMFQYVGGMGEKALKDISRALD